MNATSHIRTWVVEDHPLFRREIVAMIDDAGDLTCERDFATAEQLERHIETEGSAALPDVILMDIRLPGASGIDMTRKLRSRYPELAIVMLTQDDAEETIFSALAAGCSGYLLKSTAHAMTLRAIRDASEGAMLAPPVVAQRMRQFFQGLSGRDRYALTPRELEVLEAMCDGLTQSQIGERLTISPNTVGQHIKAIYEKLEVRTRAGAVAKALRERIVD